jgi:hypothetical protein
MLKDGHYTLKKQPVSKQLRGATNTKDKPIIFYEEVPMPDGTIQHWAYNGEKRYEIDREVLNAFRMKPLTCKHIYRATAKARGKQVATLEKQYDDYIEDAEELFDKSKGLINLKRQLTEKKSALFVFAKLKRGHKEPGIYKCRITNPHQVSTRLFHYSESKSYHTHFSLTTAREIGLCITMVGERDNALLYTDGRQHLEITHIEPFKQQYLVNLHDYRQRYKTDYARLGPFITSFARRQMYLTFKDVEQDVYRVHTDGVVVSRSMKGLPMGKGVGEWKVEKEGKCTIVNANVVEWG